MFLTILTCILSFLVSRLNNSRIKPEMINRAVVNVILRSIVRRVRIFWDKMIPIPLMKTVIISINEGQLRGREMINGFDNTKYFSFRGIRYGKPPVGSLRFKNPVPVDKWDGIENAIREGNSSPQADLLFERLDGAEDCLFLNVHTPKLPSSSNNELLPVIFWIHGGAFAHGNGNSDLYGPDYLLPHDVVLVTCNYRLGVLGFLSLGNHKVPGNLGLKDQLLALKWVKRNIAAFGGDPNNVTIYGESAGAASVHFHILSQKSTGYFHRAIAQSGTALNPWVLTEVGRERAFLLGEILGCKTNDDQVLIDFLRKVPAQVLVKNSNKVLCKEEKINHSIPFTPVIEPAGPNAFLCEDPHVLLKDGRYNHVPCIFGVNSCEGMLFLRSLNGNKKLIPRLETDPSVLTALPFQKLLQASGYVDEFKQKLKKLYFEENPIEKKRLPKILDVYSDYTFTRDILNVLKYHSLVQNSNVNTYFLLFEFEGSIGFMKKLFNGDNLQGVCHGDDLSYVFPMWLVGITPEKKSIEEEIIYQMTKRFTNFAKTGDPNCDDMQRLEVAWEPISKYNLSYLGLNDKPQMHREPLYPERIEFWNEYYQKLGCPQPLASKM